MTLPKVLTPAEIATKNLKECLASFLKFPPKDRPHISQREADKLKAIMVDMKSCIAMCVKLGIK